LIKITKKEVKKVLNLKGELLEIVIIYNRLNEEKKESDEKMKPLKPQIIKMLTNMDITKAMSQIYSVNWSHIIEERISTKKLKEELFALEDQKIKEIWKRCLYKNEYDRLTVKKRKGGENIF